MPYLNATVEEVLRRASNLPSGALHKTFSDVVINGVTYPKDTLLSLNIYHVHYNPKIWGDPHNFRPERFLSEDEKVFTKSENVVSFSVGRRQCLGEPLARDTIFLFVANLFQAFRVVCAPDLPEPSLEPAIGPNLNPQEYSVVFHSRLEA